MKETFCTAFLKDCFLMCLIIFGLLGIGYIIKTTIDPEPENLFGNPELPIIRSGQDPRLM